MTVDPTRLLQMLEPTVRPGQGAGVGATQPGKPAFENTPFSELLQAAKTDAAGSKEAGETKPVQANPLAVLGGLEQVENAALREVLAQARGSEPGLGKTGL